MSDNQAHQLVEEAYEKVSRKLDKDTLGDEDVVEVYRAFDRALEHDEADVWVTLTTAGCRNRVLHHMYPDTRCPYTYPPKESFRSALERISNRNTKVTVN